MNPLWFHFPLRSGDAAVCPSSHMMQSQLYPNDRAGVSEMLQVNAESCHMHCYAASLDTQLAQLAYEFLWVISIIFLYRPQWPSPLTIKLVQP